MSKVNYKRCYYCGSKATSKEHAPPQQLFKYFICDRITVPSCDTHNGKKSGRDQAIIHGYFKSLLGYQENLEAEVKKAILGAMDGFKYTKKTAVPSHLIKDPPTNLQALPKIAYLTKENEIHNWIRQLSAAVVFDATKRYNPSIFWSKLQIFSPNWVPAESAQGIDLDQAIEILQTKQLFNMELEKLSWLDGWSAHPRPYPNKIYRLLFHFGDENFILCHIFCNRFYWYIWLPANEELKNILINKIESQR